MNFDKIINRRETDSKKWEDSIGSDILPLWVADMDFQSPKEVIEALESRVKHGIFGYPYIKDSYYETIKEWFRKRHSWDVEKEDICFTPGVVTAISTAIQAITNKGDEVIIQPPVYFPFFSCVTNNNRKLLKNHLIYDEKNNDYLVDFEDLRKKAERKNSKLLILCSPHNPIGKVWSKDTLEKIGDICEKNNITVISDEIHGDLIFKGKKHLPYASINEIMKNHSIVCTAPSKTFNIAGLDLSNIIISNDEIREKYQSVLTKNDLNRPNILGLTAAEAAYSNGENWLNEVMEYIEDNYNYLKEFIDEKLPKIKVNSPDGTFLVWLNFSDYDLSNEELEDKLINEAKVRLNQGYSFGSQGSNFVRINIGCQRATLKEALDRIEKTFN